MCVWRHNERVDTLLQYSRWILFNSSERERGNKNSCHWKFRHFSNANRTSIAFSLKWHFYLNSTLIHIENKKWCNELKKSNGCSFIVGDFSATTILPVGWIGKSFFLMLSADARFAWISIICIQLIFHKNIGIEWFFSRMCAFLRVFFSLNIKLSDMHLYWNLLSPKVNRIF